RRGRASPKLQDGWADRASDLDARGGGQVRLASVRVEQVQECERDVLRMKREGLGGEAARLFDGLRLGGPRTELAEHPDPSLADHLRGDLVDGGEHSTDSGRRALVGDRAVGDGEVRLLQEAAPSNVELEILGPGRGPAFVGRLDEWAEDVPDLRPALPHR